MSKLTIIIVNYNTKDVLKDCLTNLNSVKPTNTRVIVVDNGSSDDSGDMVVSDFSSVELIRTANNGLSAGYNLGLKHVPESDFYLFMGTDSFPKPGCLEGVIDFMGNDKGIGVATCKLITRDGKLDSDAHRGFPTPWRSLTHFTGLDRLFAGSTIFDGYFMGWCGMDEPHEIDLCISHFMMVRNEIFNKIGGWDEDFFVYGEDVDFCWRVKEAGYKVMYLPQFECLHYKGVSVGTRKETLDVSKADLQSINRMKKETTRAMRLFYQKHMSKKYPWIVNKMVELGIFALSSLRA